MSTLPNLAAAATITQLNLLGNANGNGTHLDLLQYKGPVAFVLAVGQSVVGVGTIDGANIETSADNSAFTAVTGGNFAGVTNSANASNVGVQVKAFDVRALSRYVRVPVVISGTNANVPLQIIAIGQKERV